MQLSAFGNRFRGQTGIGSLMRDLAEVPPPAPGRDDGICRLGGGNPAHIPEVSTAFRDALLALANDADRFDAALGVYAAPGGDLNFRQTLADALRREQGWDITAEHLLLTNGSQTAFFMLFNLLAGRRAEGQGSRQILLPMSPEYIGYADVAIENGLLAACRPGIEVLGDHAFKYRLAIDDLVLDDRHAAMLVSRPTNPTGNVLTDEELAELDRMALEADIPLIIDNAYGAPFPNIIQVPVTLDYKPHRVLSMSLSKLGLPGARTGLIVARPELIRALTEMNAVMSLSPTGLMAAALEPLFASGELERLCRDLIKPWYARRVEAAQALFHSSFADLPVRVHTPEGSIFFWLWFEHLPISSDELYRRLKSRGVIVVSGHHFFPGLDDHWSHSHECIRINIAGEPTQLERGLSTIAALTRELYQGGT